MKPLYTFSSKYLKHFSLLILVGIMFLPFHSSGQTLNDTAESAVKSYSGQGGTNNLTMNLSGPFRSPNGSGKVIFYFKGDLNSGTEWIDLIDENGNKLGRAGSNQCPGSFNSTTFSVSQATLSKWFNDGKVTFTTNSGSGLDPICSNSSYDVYVELIYPYKPKLPTANFSSPDTGYVGTKLCLDNLSSRDVNRTWYVNGVPQGSGNDFSFTPAKSGSTTISLAVSNPKGSDSIAKTVYIKKQSTPVADFSASRNIIDKSETIQLFDRSEGGATSWSWDITPFIFGNEYIYPSTGPTACLGQPNNDQAKNPEVTFIRSGLYDVCLVASNKFGKDTTCKQDYIRVREEYDICSRNSTNYGFGRIYDNGGVSNDYTNNTSCDFTINTCSRMVINIREFNLKSGDHLRIYDGKNSNGKPLWDTGKFGMDGFTGKLKDVPANVIAESGYAYIEFETDGSDVASGFNLTYLSQDKQFSEPKTAFEGPDTVCPGELVSYTNTSQNIFASYSWDTTGASGNTGTYSSSKDINVSFPYSGTWNLSLIAENCGGFDTLTKKVEVKKATTGPTAGFYADRFTPLVGETVSLFDTSSNCASYYKWEFSKGVNYLSGDANSVSPKVSFTESGCYEVTLHVGNSADTVSLKKTCYIKVQCKPGVTSLTSDIGISRVKLGSIDNQSSIGKSGYTNYYDEYSTNVQKGVQQKLEIMRNTSYNEMDLKVWIDIDGDNTFDEPAEVIANKQGGNYTQYQTTFTLPDTAATGDIRMRIGTNLGGLGNEPCATNTNGEFEDYKLKVTPDITGPAIQLQGKDTVMLGACNSLPLSTMDTGTYAVDNIDGRLDTVRRTVMVDSSSSGYDSIRYEIMDNQGNTGVKYRIVKVARDQVKPSGSIQGPDPAVTHVGEQYTDAGYSGVKDNCSGIAAVEAIDNVDTNELGVYTYGYIVRDEAGNELELEREVKVIDTTAPSFSLSGSDPYYVDLDSSYQEPGIASLTDNYWESADLSLRIDGQVFTGGLDTFTLTYTVTDGSGNKEVKERTVIVRDQVSPRISSELSGGDTVTIPVRTAFDISNRVQVSDNSSTSISLNKQGSYFGILDNDGKAEHLGVFEGTWTYSDGSGNSTKLTLYVQVIDNQSPTIELNGPERVNIEQWDETVYASTDTGLTVTDNHMVTERAVDSSSTYFTKYIEGGKRRGLYGITYRAEDSAGNVATTTRVVDVGTNSSGLVESEDHGLSFEVYPNPTNGKFRIETGEGGEPGGRLVILNSVGQHIKEVTNEVTHDHTYRVDLSDASSGTYFIKYMNEGIVNVEKVMINK